MNAAGSQYSATGMALQIRIVDCKDHTYDNMESTYWRNLTPSRKDTGKRMYDQGLEDLSSTTTGR